MRFLGFANKAVSRLTGRIRRQFAERASRNVGKVSFEVALANLLTGSAHKKPNEIFSGISDEMWFWIFTEGYRQNPNLARLLPGLPDEDVQLGFTGSKGDAVLHEGFCAYKLFKELYETHLGPIGSCIKILDFGCGWGRIIRFFLKDVEPSTLWGVDPVEEMIRLCKQANQWCNFERIGTKPPSPFKDNSFDLIYGFSVFSHLSEQMHTDWVVELTRVLKSGGLLVATTRGRDFIEQCAEMRKQADLDSMHSGPRSSASAFLDTHESLSVYDSGKYCFSQLVHQGEWDYWGEAAIPKDYVLCHWTRYLDFVDFIDDRTRCTQNVIVMKKP